MKRTPIQQYWDLIVRLNCVALCPENGGMACGAPAEIAHCHGGSIVLRLQEPKAKGKKLKRYDRLVLPLCPPHGRNPYPGALDTDVDAWEAKHGPQDLYIDQLITITGIDVWELVKQQPTRRYRRPSKVLPRRLSVSV